MNTWVIKEMDGNLVLSTSPFIITAAIPALIALTVNLKLFCLLVIDVYYENFAFRIVPSNMGSLKHLTRKSNRSLPLMGTHKKSYALLT
jgi:hypothetical protein